MLETICSICVKLSHFVKDQRNFITSASGASFGRVEIDSIMTDEKDEKDEKCQTSFQTKIVFYRNLLFEVI